MMKMLIKLDEERVLSDRKYDLADMWRIVDEQFAGACTKQVLADGAVLYSGKADKDYFSCLSIAQIRLSDKEWFARYCSKWIWYDNDDNEDLPFQDINVLARERERNPIFKDAIKYFKSEDDEASVKKRCDIVMLDKKKWKGTLLPIEYTTKEYYDVVKTPTQHGVTIEIARKKFDKPVRHDPGEYDFPDRLYQDHFDGATAYGVFENGKLIAAIELFHEKWAKRIRVTELWVDEKSRRRGIGSELMTFAKQKTQENDCRMLILETQSCNVAAIDFYRSQGFELVGVLTCDYQNDDIERKEVRFEMGWFVEIDPLCRPDAK